MHGSPKNLLRNQWVLFTTMRSRGVLCLLTGTLEQQSSAIGAYLSVKVGPHLMRILRSSIGGISLSLALLLAIWEGYFFWFAGRGMLGPLDGTVGLFSPNRLGVNLAWFVTIYLSVQLLSIPFSLARNSGRFVGVLDAVASIVPLSIVLIVIFGKPALLGSGERWEAAFILLAVNCVDLFGGYAVTLALGRRTVDVVTG
jgi:hypothetical protein